MMFEVQDKLMPPHAEPMRNKCDRRRWGGCWIMRLEPTCDWSVRSTQAWRSTPGVSTWAAARWKTTRTTRSSVCNVKMRWCGFARGVRAVLAALSRRASHPDPQVRASNAAHEVKKKARRMLSAASVNNTVSSVHIVNYSDFKLKCGCGDPLWSKWVHGTTQGTQTVVEHLTDSHRVDSESCTTTTHTSPFLF